MRLVVARRARPPCRATRTETPSDARKGHSFAGRSRARRAASARGITSGTETCASSVGLGWKGPLGARGAPDLPGWDLLAPFGAATSSEPVVSHSLGARAETNTLGVEVILGNREG